MSATTGRPCPNFFVVGAARSGTTALAELLRSHDDVFVTTPKEPHFLAFAGQQLSFQGPGDEATVNSRSVTDVGAYLDLYSGTESVAKRGDASTSSLYYAEAAAKTIDRLFPDASLIAILRDPIDRAYSSYKYLQARGFETEPDFVDALGQEEERIARRWHHLWHYKRIGLYGEQLQTLLRTVPSERILVLFYEELENDPVELAQRIAAFLEIAPFEVPLQIDRINVSGTPRSQLVQRAIRFAGRHPGVRTPLARLFPFEVRERIRSANLLPSGPSPQVRLELEPFFREDRHVLESLLRAHGLTRGVALPRWLSG